MKVIKSDRISHSKYINIGAIQVIYVVCYVICCRKV